MGTGGDRYGEFVERSIGEQYERDQSKTVEVLFFMRKIGQENESD